MIVQIKRIILKRGFGLKYENSLNDLVDANPKNFKPKNEVEQMIQHYLKKLNEKIDERGKIFQKMEKYYFGKIQQVSSTMLKFYLQEMMRENQKELCILYQCIIMISKVILVVLIVFNFFTKVQNMIIIKVNDNGQVDAEQALRQFGEITIKQQFRKMKIQSHICGQQKLCKQDALILLHKYINQNQLKDQMIKYLIDDDECLKEYEKFIQTHLTNMIDDIKLNKDCNESNSIEHAILEQEASIEQLQEIIQMKLNWKFVQEYENYSLYHLSGQFIKSIHPLNCSLKKTIILFTDLKIQWFHGMIQIDVIQQYDKFKNFIEEYFIWEDKSTFKKMAFVNEQEIIQVDDFLYKITIIPSSKLLNINYKIKCDEQDDIMFLKKVTDNSTEAIIYQNVMDNTIILNEIPQFNHTITKLIALS